MVGDFKKNREKIQKALYDSGFVEVLEDSEYVIVEERNTEGSGLLRELCIANIPNETESSSYNAWCVNLEIERSPFSTPSDFRTVEKAIIFFTSCSLYILMIEMKNSLQPYGSGGILSIRQKFKATISRLSCLLPIHIYDSDFEEVEIKYFGLIAYNEDKVSSELGRDEDLAREDICEILLGKEREMHIEDYFGHTHPLSLYFCQNTETSEEMNIDLNELFLDDWDFPNAQFSNLTCPRI